MARRESTEPEEEQPMPWEGLKLRPAVKGAFALAGAVLGLIGIILSIAFYFIFTSAIGDAQSAVDAQLGSASQALTDLEGSMASAQEAAGSMGAASGNMSAALSSLSDASGGAADSFESVATAINSIPFMPAGTTSGLGSSAAKMRNASDYFGGATASLDNMSASSGQMGAKLGAVRADIGSSRASLADARGKIGSSFNSLRLSALLLSLMLFIAFLMLGGYSVSILL